MRWFFYQCGDYLRLMASYMSLFLVIKGGILHSELELHLDSDLNRFPGHICGVQ